MLNTTMVSTTAITLNLMSLIGTLFMSLICIFMFSILIRPIIGSNDVVLILVINNYLSLFAFAIVSIANNIYMIGRDYHLFIAVETLGCRIKGYMLYSLMAVIFNTFALQAAFRFFRVVYSSQVWLQRRSTFAVIIPLLWIISFLFLLPLYIWHDIQFIPMENICLLAIDSARGLIWCTIVVYSLPMNIICTIYLQLMRFIRRSSMVTSIQVKRDVIVVRRIVLVVSILMLMGIPTIVLELMLPFTDVGKPLFYRIANITMIIAMIVLSFMLIYVSPQMKAILIYFRRQQQVAPSNTHQ